MGVAKPIDNDDVIVNKIVTELSKKNYSSQELILQIINSRPFLNRSKTRWEKGIEDRAQGLTTRPLLQQILRPKFPQPRLCHPAIQTRLAEASRMRSPPVPRNGTAADTHGSLCPRSSDW